MTLTIDDKPDGVISIKKAFPECGFKKDIEVPYFTKKVDLVPEIDPHYCFDLDVTYAILMGIKYNKRVLLSGYHGTGKSTHIEQIAARLNYPHVRLNLDGAMTRTDLVGKDILTVQDGQQITQFHEGILLWALQRPVLLCLDEYDAGRPDLMFVLQRLLETKGVFTLPDYNITLPSHPFFRIYATSNTLGFGDSTGLYQGTYRLNQAQMDRWDMICHLDYMPFDAELAMIKRKVSSFSSDFSFSLSLEHLQAMVSLAHMVRDGFAQGDLSLPMSARTVLAWAHNSMLFSDMMKGLSFSFLNRLDPDERDIVKEYWQRCFSEAS